MVLHVLVTTLLLAFNKSWDEIFNLTTDVDDTFSRCWTTFCIPRAIASSGCTLQFSIVSSFSKVSPSDSVTQLLTTALSLSVHLMWSQMVLFTSSVLYNLWLCFWKYDVTFNLSGRFINTSNIIWIFQNCVINLGVVCLGWCRFTSGCLSLFFLKINSCEWIMPIRYCA